MRTPLAVLLVLAAAILAAPAWAQGQPAPAPKAPAAPAAQSQPAPTAQPAPAAKVPATPAAQAQGAPANDMQALRAQVRADKRALVASTLDLTPPEAAKFWPIYDTYQRHLNAANRQVALAVEDLVGYDKPMSNAFAKQLTAEMLAADTAELKARTAMQKSVLKALPPKKAARYLQLEGKIRAFQDYDLAVAIPLVK